MAVWIKILSNIGYMLWKKNFSQFDVLLLLIEMTINSPLWPVHFVSRVELLAEIFTVKGR